MVNPAAPGRALWWLAAVLGVATLVTRWPLRTQFLYNWDAANFALGVRQYNVALHQPHPPGYPYFVGLGSLLNLMAGDANAALQTVALALEVLAVVALVVLGARMFGLRAGVAAGLLLVTSVTFWTYGEVALAYPALAAFSVLTALFAYETVFLGRDRLVWCAAAYALGTGFRPDLTLFLAPLVLLAALRQPRRRVVAAVAVAGGGVLAWLVPVALVSGGADQYLAVFSAYAAVDVVERYSPTSRGVLGLAVNVRDTAQYLFFALYGSVLVVVAGALLWLRPRPERPEWRLLGFLVLWALPMSAFYLLLHVGDPGYVFSLLPPVLLVGVGGLARALQARGEVAQGLAACAFTLVLLANTLVFFVHDRPLTLAGLRASDRATGGRIEFLRGFAPGEVMVLTYDSHKQLRFYLPELPHNLWLDTSTPRRQAFGVPPGVRWAVLTDPSVFNLTMNLRAEPDFVAGAWIARLPVQPGQTLVYENRRLRVE